ncbi:MAG: DUF4198 domain-containing protein [Pyrinomonadaceae bacterium]|nr:DUF4198 domain-containing protein [Pyrinomonadaceae bacterium]
MELQNHSYWEIILTIISVFSTFMLGHNFWLTAKNEAETIKIELITSDNFPASDSIVKQERIKDFRVFTDNDSQLVNDYQAEEKTLVAQIKNDENANLAAIELYPHPIVLEARKFAGYTASENAETFVAPDFIGGETAKEQRESYSKFAKVLFNNSSHAQIVNHRLEIVLQDNPSRLKADEKLSVKVLFDGKPIANLRVSSGAKNSNNGKYFGQARTDENGFAEIAISQNDLCFVRTHFIRKHQDAENFEWESFWASITFRL